MPRSVKPKDKKEIEIVLHRFYHYKVYDYENGGEKEFGELPGQYKDWSADNYDVEYKEELEYTFRGIPLPEIVEVYNGLDTSGYDRVTFQLTINGDGHSSQPRISGFRMETDEEFASRCKEWEDEQERIQSEKEKKKQLVVENKRKKLEQLKKELGEA